MKRLKEQKKQLSLIFVAFLLLLVSPIVAIALNWRISVQIPLICGCFLGISLLSLKYKNLILRVLRGLINFIYRRIRKKPNVAHVPTDIILPLISPKQQSRLDDAIKITFTGDLILLREAVERAYNPESGKYEFDAMFEHVREFWQSADLSIGVFEGPLGGAELGYSTSNYGDGVPLHLNFPDTYATAVKDAGINLVTLANNHMFDVGPEGAFRTPQILDKIGLPHVGFNSDKQAYNQPRIIDVCGKRIGILAYTYGLNGQTEDFFFEEPFRNCIKPLLSPKSKYFKRNVEIVKEDFKRMKAANPDLIIVLPHIGDQFRSTPDDNQLRWCEIFTELGADLILSDHPHHVQPIEWRKNKEGKNVLIVHCPGNFINSFVEEDGDASMIASICLDRKSLDPFAVGVTPIYAYCPQNGCWTGLPTYKAVTDIKRYNNLSRADYRRINEVNKLVTRIALGTPLDVETAQKEYLHFRKDGGVRHITFNREDITIPDKSRLAKSIKEAPSVCFVGDSITEGTKNGGVGWFEPLLPHFPEKQFSRFAVGGKTTKWLLNNVDSIAHQKADLYVVAIGCNDIRYRNPEVCAMTPDEYIGNLDQLATAIRSHNPNSNLAFIAPWRSLHFDLYFHVETHAERMKIYAEYTMALSEYCDRHGFIFIDPNPLIFERPTTPDIRVKEGNDLLVDFIHPTAYRGVKAYCQAVINS